MFSLDEIINQITPLDRQQMDFARNRQLSLLKPPKSLGKLEDFTIQLSGIYKDYNLPDLKKAVLTFAADHGVYKEGVSKDPQFFTARHFPNFITDAGVVGSMAKYLNVKVYAVDVGINTKEKMPDGIYDEKIDYGTKNIAIGPAMTREQALKSIEVGMKYCKKAIDEGYNMLAMGEMGIANTTPSTAIISVITGKSPKQITGMGSGLDTDQIIHKAIVIEKALKNNKIDRNDPIDILSKVGGFEIGAMVGVILYAAKSRIPVVLDGVITYAATMIAYELCNLVKGYIFPSHWSKDISADYAIEYLGFKPFLNLNMGLGEGSGAMVAFSILDLAVFTYKNMKTFDEVGFFNN